MGITVLTFHVYPHTHKPYFPLQEKFKTGLLAQSEEFKKQVGTLVEEFHTNGPFTSVIPTEEALEKITVIRQQMAGLKEQELQLRKGLAIFKIDQPPSKDVAQLERVGV